MKTHYIVSFLDSSLISNIDDNEYLKTTIAKATQSHLRDDNKLTYIQV